MSTKAGAGFRCFGMNAVNVNSPLPYLPAYDTRTRLRTDLPSIISASGSAGANDSSFGRSTGRRPYSSRMNSARSSGARTFSHCSTVVTFSPLNVVIRSGTFSG